MVVNRYLAIPASELQESASRSGGPGGQHVNKTNTRVTLRWSVRDSEVLSETQRKRLHERLGSRLTRSGELVVHCGSMRSRARNRELARERLAKLVREALSRRPTRVSTKVSRTQRKRRVADKRQRGDLKRTRVRSRPDDDD